MDVSGGGAKRFCDPLEAPLQGGQEQVALGGKEAEDIRLGDADAAGDALDGRPVQATVGELVDGGFDQRLTPLGGGDAPAGGLSAHPDSRARTGTPGAPVIGRAGADSDDAVGAAGAAAPW